MNTLIQALVQANFEPERIVPKASMARYTTFRVGGEADVLVNVASSDDIRAALLAARNADVPLTLIGNGSNLIVRDGGIRGIVIRLAHTFAGISREGDDLYLQAGTTLRAAAQYAQQAGLEGLSPLAGIPGTIGGAVIMNAGSYGSEMSQLVTSVDGISLRDGKPVHFEADELDFGYRHSALMDAGIIVTDVVMHLKAGDPEAIAAQMEEYAAARREKQPLEYPSAGSTFKRPEGFFAGKLIDNCGLRGLRVGDAQVSEKHAGFIINLGHATASDILALMDNVVQRVEEQTGVTLEPEVRILGEDLP